MAEVIFFFVGMLVCGLVVQAADLSHQYFEARRRVMVARIRGTKVDSACH